ncbi:MAG: hypothetical protein FD124_705 [Alphaproteobacteria bacterium]|nr:MAG: hypothetical protein FD160_631 [Caulobacteraceae bacterium]TPW08038.1 MAG: hypothetical protein FD124_705 [Alphaproteobacteria bacterium]
MVSQRLILTGAGACLAIGAIAGPANAQVAYDRDHNISVQQRAYDEHAPLGIGLGGFLLFPQLDLGVEYNDNIFAATANETEDTILVAGASARLASQWSRHALNFFGGVQSRTFTDNEDDNAVDWRLGADGRLDIIRDMHIAGGAAFGRTTESRFAGNGPANLVEPIEYDFEEAHGELVRDVNRIRAGISFAYGKYDYKDGQVFAGPVFEQDDRDNDVLDITGRLDYALSPDTAVFGSVTHRARDYDLDSGTANGGPILDRDSEGWRYLIGANFDITSVVRGEAAVGYSTTEYDAAAFADVDGFSAYGQAEWFVTKMTSITANASRETVDAGISGAAGIQRTSIGVRADHELRRDIILFGGVSLDQDEYQSFDRDDDRTRFNVGVDWYANRLLKVGAGYERFEQESTGVNKDRDFTGNVFALRASLRR